MPSPRSEDEEDATQLETLSSGEAEAEWPSPFSVRPKQKQLH